MIHPVGFSYVYVVRGVYLTIATSSKTNEVSIIVTSDTRRIETLVIEGNVVYLNRVKVIAEILHLPFELLWDLLCK